MNRKSIHLITALVFVCGMAWAAYGQDAAPTKTDPVRDILDQAEKAHDADDFQKTMSLLQKAEQLSPDNPEILWKEARGYFDFADQKPNDEDWQKKNIYPGFEKAKAALALNDKSAGAHKWYAILIGRVGEIEGTKQKILNSYQVKEHILRAIELDPDNAGNYHVMGRWNYTLADLSWIERQVAALIYATPPEASFKDALSYFKRAHQLDPDDIRNVLYIGKTYTKLDDDAQAAEWFKKAIKMKADTDSDRALQSEAQQDLDDL